MWFWIGAIVVILGSNIVTAVYFYGLGGRDEARRMGSAQFDPMDLRGLPVFGDKTDEVKEE